MTGEPRVERFEVPGLMATGSAWSQVTRAGRLVFVSGQVAWNDRGEVVGRGSVGEQTEIVFENLKRALEAAGSGLDLLARFTVYLTDRDHIADFRKVRDEALAGVGAASTLVVVSGLADPELLVEVDAIAIARE